jgi:hypothetical protein
MIDRYEESMAQRDLLGAMLTVSRVDRPSWLFFLAESFALSDDEVRKLAVHVWSDTEFPFQDRTRWMAFFRECGFCTDSTEPLASGELVIYRGQSRINPLGMSWTLDRARAEWFAKRFSLTDHAVVRGVIDREHVFAYITGRSEEEVVVPPRRVRKRKWLESPTS